MAKGRKNKNRTAKVETQIQQEEASDVAAGNRMVDQLYGNQYVPRTAEEQSTLDMLRGRVGTAGQETSRMADTRQMLTGAVGDVYDPMKDAQVQQLLQRHVAGLEGLSAPENQALRAQMIRSEQSGTQSALRGMRAMAGTAGVTGRAALGATGNIYRNAAMARALGESDLLAKNVGLKQQALANYTGALGGFTGQSIAAGEEVGRRMGTLSDYTMGSEAMLKQAEQAAATQFGDASFGLAADERERWLQSFLGGQSLNIARRGGIRGENLANKGLKIAQNAYQ